MIILPNVISGTPSVHRDLHPSKIHVTWSQTDSEKPKTNITCVLIAGGLPVDH